MFLGTSAKSRDDKCLANGSLTNLLTQHERSRVRLANFF